MTTKYARKVNRLILLGNGFDLAHGLLTGYNDFIKWYLKRSFQHAQDNHTYSDLLMNITVSDVSTLKSFSDPIKDVSSFVDYYYIHGFLPVLTSNYLKIKGWANNYPNPFKIEIKLNFFFKIVSSCSFSNWVQIENIYYSELKNIFSQPIEDKYPLIQQLNNGFSQIIDLLKSYLATIETGHISLEYREIIKSPIKLDEFALQYNSKTLIGKTMILNFNYTDTINKYLHSNEIDDININFIHGQLNEVLNPIIFGFGDEMDNGYANFEAYQTIGQFDYFKSFLYLQTSNYYNLIRFIQSNDYQVYILGHSCGLSDRTMLNMIFEHENCKSIKIFYHERKDNSNNYTSLTQEIARHFKDKQSMRGKIVSMDKSSPMPQVKA